MDLRAVAFVLLLTLTVLAGCNEGDEQQPSIRYEAFRATFAYSASFGGASTTVVFDGAHALRSSDGQVRQAYTLTQDPDATWQGTIQFRQTAFDAALRPVRQWLPCGMYSAAYGCEGGFVSWDTVLVMRHNLFATPAAPDVRAQDVADWNGRAMRFTFDDTLAPVKAEVLFEGYWAPYWNRTSYERLGDLSPADTWPTTPQLHGEGPWQNPLFPGADQDLVGLGFTPLGALEALRAASPFAAMQLEAGCVVQTDIDVRTLASFERDGLLAEVVFSIIDPSGVESVHRVEWREGPSGRTLQVPPLGLLPFSEAGETVCTERTTLPWPQIDAALVAGWVRPADPEDALWSFHVRTDGAFSTPVSGEGRGFVYSSNVVSGPQVFLTVDAQDAQVLNLQFQPGRSID